MAMTIEAAGVRRTFRLVAGLTPGYTHSPLALPTPADDAEYVIARWQADQEKDHKPHLNGVVSTGTAVYVGPNGRGREPVVVFEGEVSVRDQTALGDSEVVLLLNSLADALSAALGQKRVHVAYRDEAWVLVRS